MQHIRICLLTISSLIVGQSAINAQQKLISLNRFFTGEIERSLQCDSTKTVHTGSKPFLESQLNKECIFGLREDTSKIYSAGAGKLLEHHLFSVRKDDFFLALDPLFDFSLGKDVADTTSFKTQKMLTNQRGVQLIGDIGKKFSFQTSFYETQIVVPLYLKEFCDSTGIFPGFGRTKDYNGRGYDFAMSNGWISYTPIQQLNIQFGNGKSFYGHGYRSLLWSDAFFTHPYLKATARLAGGKIQYSSMYASLQSLDRLPNGEVPEALFARKGSTVNYLSWIPFDGLEIGFFESVVWLMYDSTDTRPLSYGAYIPLIGVNTAINGYSGENNAMTGLNIKIRTTPRSYIYGQFAADDPEKGAIAYQAGLKYYDLLVKNLDIQIEWNVLKDYMYTNHHPLQSYTHFNQPLGHPTGGSTNELLVIFNHRYRRFFTQLKINNIIHSIGPDGSWRTDPEAQYNNIAAWPERVTSQADVEAGFMLNPKTNFRCVVSYTHRTDVNDYNWTDDFTRKTSYFSVSLRTNLINRYSDF